MHFVCVAAEFECEIVAQLSTTSDFDTLSICFPLASGIQGTN